MNFYQYNADNSEDIPRKVKIFSVLAILCFLVLIIRIWYLQILRGHYFQALSENNRIRLNSLPGYRGLIKDRNGKTLVSIRPSFNLYITPEDVKDLEATLDLLEESIDFDRNKIRNQINNSPSHQEVLLRSDITRKKVAFVEENKLRLPGVFLKVEPLRFYVYDDMASQTLGYLGEISKSKLNDLEMSDYRQGDLIGKDGLESIFESDLRGEKGYREIEVDVSGRELRVLRKLPPKSGNHLILTLDIRIQKVLEELMIGTEGNPKIGSVVVMDVRSGEVLALISKPSFNPNLFASGISRKHWQRLIHDPSHPLQNKVIDGQYPPGSTYKIVTAFAGLEEKLITKDSVIYCPGEFRLGRGRYRCWKKGGHGRVNLHKAIVESCDVFFYTLGNRLGIDNLAKYAKSLGLGAFTSINLIGEKPGLIPSTQWKLLSRGKPWLLGETISASIGQGYNLVTPLQQANMMSVVANGGILRKPLLVQSIQDPDGNIVRTFKPEVISKVMIKPETLEAIKKGLYGVVNEPHGTGFRSRLKNYTVAGKTGTAQVIAMKKGDEVIEEDETPFHFRDHAWFVAFAPYEDPRVAVSVIIEHGGHGGTSAAPIAKEILKAYFKHYPTQKPLKVQKNPTFQD